MTLGLRSTLSSKRSAFSQIMFTVTLNSTLSLLRRLFREEPIFCAAWIRRSLTATIFGGKANTSLGSRRGGVGQHRCVSSHALQQQHDGVELLPGSVVGPQRHDEVVQTVPRALRRHDDQFVFEAVRAGVLEKGVVTRLRGKHSRHGEKCDMK